MAITTSSSINVKPRRHPPGRFGRGIWTIEVSWNKRIKQGNHSMQL
jgi:hypothetical protein